MNASSLGRRGGRLVAAGRMHLHTLMWVDVAYALQRARARTRTSTRARARAGPLVCVRCELTVIEPFRHSNKALYNEINLNYNYFEN